MKIILLNNTLLEYDDDLSIIELKKQFEEKYNFIDFSKYKHDYRFHTGEFLTLEAINIYKEKSKIAEEKFKHDFPNFKGYTILSAFITWLLFFYKEKVKILCMEKIYVWEDLLYSKIIELEKA